MVDRLFREVTKLEKYQLEIDLEQQTIRKPNGENLRFEIDQFWKKYLLEGLDDIVLTLQHEEKIRAHEQRLSPFRLVHH
jgi:3-isopropylmalate/(R)-2-methylmalate dehydratase small subunit